MVLPPKPNHPAGEVLAIPLNPLAEAIEVETYAGKVHVEWDPDAAVTPLGQLPFFIQFLKMGGRFDPWVNAMTQMEATDPLGGGCAAAAIR